MDKRVYFNKNLLPLLLIFPQIAITLIFFIWPSLHAIYQSFLLEDPFGLETEFVFLENFHALFSDQSYYLTLLRTLFFGFAVALLSMAFALLLAAAAGKVTHGAKTFCTLIIAPYALAPALSGVLWMFMLNPSIGSLTYLLAKIGIKWDHYTNPAQAMLLIILASSVKQISYNFVFFYAAVKAVPRSLLEASAIDGAKPFKRFWTIIFPLISPTVFFLLVINIVYAFFDTFGIIHAVTDGGPAGSTEILVFKVFKDGFIGLDLGSSAAQSVVLLLMVTCLTIIQFKFIERKVKYA